MVLISDENERVKGAEIVNNIHVYVYDRNSGGEISKSYITTSEKIIIF
jgi:hypothetical protein